MILRGAGAWVAAAFIAVSCAGSGGGGAELCPAGELRDAGGECRAPCPEGMRREGDACVCAGDRIAELGRCVLPEGASCDFFISPPCAAGGFCFTEVEGGNVGACTAATRPEIIDAGARVDGARSEVVLRIQGRDASRDVVGFRLAVFLEDGSSVVVWDPTLSEAVSLSISDRSYGLAEFDLQAVMRHPDPDRFHGVTRATLWLQDSQMLLSEPFPIDLEARPQRAIGEACDPDGFLDRCVDQARCQGDGRCVEVFPPTLGAARVWHNPGEWSLAVEIEGSDTDGDIFGVLVELLDDDGGPLALLEGDVRFLPDAPTPLRDVDWEGSEYIGRYSGSVAEATELAAVRVTAVDAAGQRSETLWVEDIRGPESREEGESCDPHRARTLCAPDFPCLDGPEPRCAPLTADCPADWEVVDLNAHARGEGWHFESDSLGERDHSFPKCTRGGFDAVFRFTPERSGSHRITSASPDDTADTVLYLRRACSYTAWEFEMACVDDPEDEDTRLARIDVELEAGVPVWIFLEGYAGDEDLQSWSGPFSLSVSAEGGP